LIVAFAVPADHVVAAGVANPGARPAGGNAVLISLIDVSLVLMHSALLSC
jgi:hypothetical protein